MGNAMVRWLGAWLGLTALWVVLAAKTTLPFVLLAGATALLTVGALAGLERMGLVRGHGKLRWLRHFARLPGQMLSDSALLAGALWRRIARGEDVQGRYLEIPFDPGAADDPQEAARRALVALGVSLPPNTYLVWADPHKKCLLLHQLVPTPEAPGHGDRKWPL